MVLGAENVSRIKLFTEDGELCAKHKEFKVKSSKLKVKGINLIDKNPYVILNFAFCTLNSLRFAQGW